MVKSKAVIGGRAHNLEQVREVSAQGYPFAEMSLYDPKEVESMLAELVRIREQTGTAYIAHYPNEDNPFDIAVLRERFFPRLKRLVDLSRELGISKGTIHFWMDVRWARPDLIAGKIDLLGEMVDFAEARGITLCIENLSERVESFQKAFDEIPSLRMTLDIGHGQLLSRQNTSFAFIRHAFEKIAHIHVHDNRGGTSVKDDLHLALGEGIIDYPGILKALGDKGYDSTITMEVKPGDMKKSREVLERYLYPS
ncbi:MAG: sugar phosphate isomerase/epimerase [Bacteriovoracaceae bacterium]|nr:sugar phosphate isomerase/epimerase [Bacteriovoracaceae bacterium]